VKVQDFFSVVQLGVAVHAGTAFLQLSGEFGIAPVERRVGNISAWIADERELGNVLEDEAEELKDIIMMIYIFKEQYYKVYRNHVTVTLSFSAALAFCLAVMSFLADADISVLAGLGLILLSFVPAVLTFASLWQQSANALAPIERAVCRMEDAIHTPTCRTSQ
jgi:hypothetical protein